jgi:hypothetical protein
MIDAVDPCQLCGYNLHIIDRPANYIPNNKHNMDMGQGQVKTHGILLCSLIADCLWDLWMFIPTTRKLFHRFWSITIWLSYMLS